MTDREALAAALEYYDANDQAFVMSHVPLYIAAARERLAQLPENCGTCNGTGSTFDDPNCYACTCPTCHGSGKLYPAGLVERIARHFMMHGTTGTTSNQIAVVMLDALNGEML